MPAEPRLGVILPVAGASSRLGQPKQLLQVSGVPLVCRAARLALELHPVRVVVVTGAHAGQVRPALGSLPVTTVHNAAWRSGLGASIACGAGSLPPGLDGILIMHCDQWRLELRDLHLLVEYWNGQGRGISAARHAAVTGPPVIFSGTFLAELRALRGRVGARSLIRAHPAASSFLDLERAAFDLDTPADLAQLEQFSGQCP